MMHSRIMSHKIMSGDMMVRVLRTHSPAPPPLPPLRQKKTMFDAHSVMSDKSLPIIAKNDKPLAQYDKKDYTQGESKLRTALTIAHTVYDQSPMQTNNLQLPFSHADEHLSLPTAREDVNSTATTAGSTTTVSTRGSEQEPCELGQSVTSSDILEFNRRRARETQLGETHSLQEEWNLSLDKFGVPIEYATPRMSGSMSLNIDHLPSESGHVPPQEAPVSGIAFFQWVRPKPQPTTKDKPSTEGILTEASRFRNEQLAYLADKERRQARMSSFPMVLVPTPWRQNSLQPQERVHRKSAPARTRIYEIEQDANVSKPMNRAATRGRRRSSMEYIKGNFAKHRGSIQETIGKIIRDENMEEHGRRRKLAGQEKVEAYRAQRRSSVLAPVK
ncbi:hypothetical protein EC973_006016 [Apophysomyces ossiformis]|uniref:Uncharacterized protein n=1 Tax=Apophysomyces ossiformis TaxID=679940 RepID=A0A8H7BZ05_9FUNG|nr:hypothetical protein EC973_006016 [Apophysomyces ossiformis]